MRTFVGITVFTLKRVTHEGQVKEKVRRKKTKREKNEIKARDSMAFAIGKVLIGKRRRKRRRSNPKFPHTRRVLMSVAL